LKNYYIKVSFFTEKPFATTFLGWGDLPEKEILQWSYYWDFEIPYAPADYFPKYYGVAMDYGDLFLVRL